MGQMMRKLIGSPYEKGRNRSSIKRNFSVNSSDDCSDEFEMNVVRYKPDGLESLCRSTKFSRKELQLMYRGFKQECPNGLVNEDTFKGIYAQFFPQGDSSNYAHHIFRSFDHNRSGTINFEEFVSGLSILTRGNLQEKLKWAFTLYDLDGDGCITRDEMYSVISSVYDMIGGCLTPNSADHSCLAEHVERVFNKLDINKDGVVTIDEFMDILSTDEDIAKSMAFFDGPL
ncbi:KCNIP4 (predicted) [Pycnogonum litorale]